MKRASGLGKGFLFQMCRSVWIWGESKVFDLFHPFPPRGGEVFGLSLD